MNKLLASVFVTISFGAIGSGVAAQSLDDVLVEVAPLSAQVALGDTIDLAVTVTNTSGSARNDLIAHIDITSPDRDGSVDPEDWTSTLSKQVGPLNPGASATIDWNIQPISPGTFQVYAVALAPDAPDVAGSNVLSVSVEDQRSLNPQGVLPVVIIVPAAVGALFVWRLRRSRA